MAEACRETGWVHASSISPRLFLCFCPLLLFFLPLLLCRLLSLFLINTAPGIYIVNVIWGTQAGGTTDKRHGISVLQFLPLYTPRDPNCSHICGDGGEGKKSVDHSGVPKSKTVVHRWISILHRWIPLLLWNVESTAHFYK